VDLELAPVRARQLRERMLVSAAGGSEQDITA